MSTLSVCIPIYNSDVRTLVQTLCAQIDALATSQVDIVLIDDASDLPFKQCNQFTASYVRTIDLPENVGRSKIRNAFLNHTDADYLLFIDGDSSIVATDFLAKYLTKLATNRIDVLVGASCYAAQKPEPRFRLRWQYSSKRESLNDEQRMRSQHAGFKTNNFIIRRSILAQFPFEERLTGYGHEDTHFGLQLQANHIPIEHIDNPVWNLKLDTNEEFLTKTDSALRNLLWLRRNAASFRIEESNRLLKGYILVSKNSFLKLLFKWLSFNESILAQMLRTGRAPLFIFDLYRLSRLEKLDKDAPNDLR